MSVHRKACRSIGATVCDAAFIRVCWTRTNFDPSVQLDPRVGNYLPTDLRQPDCRPFQLVAEDIFLFDHYDQSAVWIQNTLPLNSAVEVLLLTYLPMFSLLICHSKKPS